MSQPVKAQILKQVETLPSLPATVSKVMAITADPESCADDLVRAILSDQAMCATILKIANSAFFGIPREVASMDKAVNVLGFNEVQNIVLGKAVFNSFHKINKVNKHAVDAFWQHSFHCGLAAKIIAEDLKHPPSELFIAGLIHDIGKLVLFMSLPTDYLPIFEMEEVTEVLTCSEVELQYFNIDHGEIGFHLLSRWMFPEQLLSAVGYHHYPESCHCHAMYAIIVQIADILAVLACHSDMEKRTHLHDQITSLLPKAEALWAEYTLTINEQQLQDWATALRSSIDKDAAILGSFSS